VCGSGYIVIPILNLLQNNFGYDGSTGDSDSRSVTITGVTQIWSGHNQGTMGFSCGPRAAK
jgi:hypothetical protein